MSSSDSAMFIALEERVKKLEITVADLVDKAYGKDISEEVYAGSTHAEEPKRGPGRPPNQGRI